MSKSKRTLIWKTLDKLASAYEAPQPAKEKDLADVLKQLLNTNNKKQGSSVKSHFDSLFSGLDYISSGIRNSPHKKAYNITQTSSVDLQNYIKACSDKAELKKLFDQLYYSESLMPSLASAVIKNKHSIDDLRYYQRMVFFSSQKWSTNGKRHFQLQLANKYYVMKMEDEARAFTVDIWDSNWKSSVNSGSLNSGNLYGLAKALLCLGDIDQCVRDITNPQSLLVFWRVIRESELSSSETKLNITSRDVEAQLRRLVILNDPTDLTFIISQVMEKCRDDPKNLVPIPFETKIYLVVDTLIKYSNQGTRSLLTTFLETNPIEGPVSTAILRQKLRQRQLENDERQQHCEIDVVPVSQR